MERNSVLRVLLIAASALLIIFFVLPKLTGGGQAKQPIPDEHYVNAPGFMADRVDPVAEGAPAHEAPNEGALCEIEGPRYKATLSGRGAAIVNFVVTDAQYASGDEGLDLSTTPAVERWRSLRTLFREGEGSDQLPYDRFLWQVEAAADKKSCTFRYEAAPGSTEAGVQSAGVRIEKVVKASERPFELEVRTTVTNLASAPKSHTFAIGTYAFRKNSEVKGHLGRVSPFQTEILCASSADLERKEKDAFKDGPYQQDGIDRFAAVSNYYFAQALVPEAGSSPRCWALAEKWFAAGQAPDDDDAAAIYHAKLIYPSKLLAPNESVSYTQTAFMGPKERTVLTHVADGRPQLGDLINLGFFSPVAKGLVAVLVFFHGKVGSWGLAIILMTLCVRLALFPLSLKQIRTTIAMRKLKPELDELNARHGSDAQARNLAMMELYRKRGVNPLGGCLPQLVQMPVWWAMYSTLQTAVEMYHQKFLWFSDLSEPDTFYILPVLLGGLGFLQARIMPQQPGADPAQQRMMMYMMPAIFTVMMLFLPAALGVYMMTNSVLGIVQQLAVEAFAKRAKETDGGAGGSGIVVTDKSSEIEAR